MAVPRMIDHRVGGWYRTIGGEEEEGGEVEISSWEYCSLSECIVTPDSAIGFELSSDAILVEGRGSWGGRMNMPRRCLISR